MGGRGKPISRNNAPLQTPDNSAQIKAMQQQQQQAQAFAKQQADALAAQKAAQDAARKAAQEAAQQQAISSQSANARSLVTENQQEIGNKLQGTLSTPIQAGTMNYATQASGYSPAAVKQDQAAQMGSAYSPATMASPSMAIAAKVNAGIGGTNVVQNQYTMPNTTGLAFGGS